MSEQTNISFEAALMIALRADAQKELEPPFLFYKITARYQTTRVGLSFTITSHLSNLLKYITVSLICWYCQ